MRYALIENYNIDNGIGARTVLWTQGCPHKCKGCHNAHTWNETGGKEFTDKERDLILYYLDEYFPKDFSVLGGEPLAPYNIDGVTELLRYIKEVRPQTNIWLWTGYLFEEMKDKEVMKYLDVLIDGNFIEELKVDGLKFKGSTNQRVIDVPKSLSNKKVVLL